jgi:hypothetical protein
MNLLYQALTTFALTTASNQSTAFRGPRFITIHSSQFSDSAGAATTPGFAAGSTYFGALVINTSNQTKAQSLYGQFVGVGSIQRSGTLGTSVATVNTMPWEPWAGLYNTAALPAALTLSSVSAQADVAGFVPHIILENLYSSY